MRTIRRVAVLGAGTMGSRIAAHFANAGIPARLLDIVIPNQPNRNAAALKGVTPESLPVLSADLKKFGRGFVDFSGQRPNNETAEGLASAVTGAALSVLLFNNSAKAESVPGHNITMTHGEIVIEPFNVMPSLAAGKITSETWLRQCRELDISAKDLGTVTATES